MQKIVKNMRVVDGDGVGGSVWLRRGGNIIRGHGRARRRERERASGWVRFWPFRNRKTAQKLMSHKRMQNDRMPYRPASCTIVQEERNLACANVGEKSKFSRLILTASDGNVRRTLLIPCEYETCRSLLGFVCSGNYNNPTFTNTTWL